MDSLTTLLTEPKFAVLSLIATLIFLYSASKWLLITDDPREPPREASVYPVFGHIMGMLRHGVKYYTMLCQRSQDQLFTMMLGNSKFYIVNSLSLLPNVQRLDGNLSFDPIMATVTEGMLGQGWYALCMRTTAAADEDKDESVITAMHDKHRIMLSPGNTLSQLLSLHLKDCLSTLNACGPGIDIDLFKFSVRTVAYANMRAMYGPHNIFDAEPRAYDDYFEWEGSLFWFTVGGPMTPLLIPRACAARRRLKQALEKYFAAGNDAEASQMIHERKRTHVSKNFTPEQQAHAEIMFMFGLMSNSTPTMGWMLCVLFSDTSLLAAARKQIDDADVVSIEGDKRTISMDKLKAKCPLLVSVFREVLRYYSRNNTTRLVLEDTLLADTWLLKKGAVVLVPGEPIHADSKIWGQDAQDFNPYRFVNNPSGSVFAPVDGAKGGSVAPTAFRAFGSGKHLCPGRWFAQDEIVGFAALVLLGWEITGAGGKPLTVPRAKEAKVPFGILKPEHDVAVRISRRAGLENVEWRFG